MRKTLITLSVSVGLLAATSLTQTGLAQTPTSQPLVQASNMRYLGSFRLPANDGSGASPAVLAAARRLPDSYRFCVESICAVFTESSDGRPKIEVERRLVGRRLVSSEGIGHLGPPLPGC